MKTSRTSTMPHFSRAVVSDVSEQHLSIYNELVALLKPYSKRLEVRKSGQYQYELWTEHEYRTTGFRAQRKRGVLFAGASILKPHVGFYFYPLHIHEELKASLTEELLAILKGRSTFHIKHLPDSMKANVADLIEIGFKYYQKQGWIFK